MIKALAPHIENLATSGFLAKAFYAYLVEYMSVEGLQMLNSFPFSV